MKCKNCECAKRGWFSSLPEAYVCTGVKEPFVIENYVDAKCTEYSDEQWEMWKQWERDHVHSSNDVLNITTAPQRDDGIYMQLFVVKDGVRYDMKTISLKEVSTTLTNSLMDGIEKLWNN